jgi:peroxiredoxin
VTPAVGDRAPDFTLVDSTGATRTLSSFAAHGRLVLLFFRGHW